MRKIFILLTLSMYGFLLFAQQAKKPTIMILPSDNWCNQRYFMTSFSDQGNTVKVPNYQQAFLEDTELDRLSVRLDKCLPSKDIV